MHKCRITIPYTLHITCIRQKASKFDTIEGLQRVKIREGNKKERFDGTHRKK